MRLNTIVNTTRVKLYCTQTNSTTLINSKSECIYVILTNAVLYLKYLLGFSNSNLFFI